MLRCSWQSGLQLGGAKRIATVARKVDLDHSATLALMRDCSWRLLNALWQVSEEKELGCRSYKIRASSEAAQSRNSPDKLAAQRSSERRGASVKK